MAVGNIAFHFASQSRAMPPPIAVTGLIYFCTLRHILIRRRIGQKSGMTPTAAVPMHAHALLNVISEMATMTANTYFDGRT